ncbi:MAG: hypothetical protein K1X94_16890 [Sandaracinaceae bacterium]|nr:hypothetical protein [Sandaracinaceae bacterium]
MADDDTKKPETDAKPDASERPRADTPPPNEELRKALDHLGKAALSFRDRYLSDEKIHEVSEKARVNAEQIAEETEKALRKAGGSLDTFAVDAEKSVEKVAVDAEKALREAQKAAAPALRAGLAKLSSLIEGKREPLPEVDENARENKEDNDGAPGGGGSDRGSGI